MGVIYFLFILPFVCGATFEPSFMWSGGVTVSSAEFRVGYKTTPTLPAKTHLRFVVAGDEDLQDNKLFAKMIPTLSTGGVYPFQAVDLMPNTTYFYAVTKKGDNTTGVGEIQNTDIGRFRTFPENPEFLRFGFSSALRSDSTSTVFDDILTRNPEFFIFVGNLHFDDIDDDDISLYDEAYRSVLRNQHLQTSMPLMYIWDDRDYGPGGAGLDSRTAAADSYRNNFPHYSLPADSTADKTAIYQAFDYGKIRFIMTDLKSESTEEGKIMSKEQMTWLKNELINGAENYKMIIWVSTKSWWKEGDGWGGHQKDREEISNLISTNVDNLVMISGGDRTLGIDDGQHTDVSHVRDGKGAGFPVLNAGPLDDYGDYQASWRFSEGCYSYQSVTQSQYMIVEISLSEDPPSTCFVASGFSKIELGTYKQDPVIGYGKCVPLIESYLSNSLTKCSSVMPIWFYLLTIAVCIVVLGFLTLATIFWRTELLQKRDVILSGLFLLCFAISNIPMWYFWVVTFAGASAVFLGEALVVTFLMIFRVWRIRTQSRKSRGLSMSVKMSLISGEEDHIHEKKLEEKSDEPESDMLECEVDKTQDISDSEESGTRPRARTQSL